MSFTPEQVSALKAPLDARHVLTRKQAGRELSYVEGWRAIDEANRIFGFDAWDRETVEMRQLGEPREVQGKWRVGYMARVRVTVRTLSEATYGTLLIMREGTGYGSGIAVDLGDAHESAIKEAETDAMKRALMTFGNPFGLALYDKTQANVTNGEPAPWQARFDHLVEAIPRAANLEELRGMWDEAWKHAKHMPQAQQDILIAIKDARKIALTPDVRRAG